MTDAITAGVVARAIGLALVHFVWQGAAIGAATALVLVAMRRSTPQVRYAAACIGLAALIAAPIATITASLGKTPAAMSSATGTSIVAPIAVQTTSAAIEAGQDRWMAAARAWLEPRLPYVVFFWSVGVVIFAIHLLGGWWRVDRIVRAGIAIETSRWTAVVRDMTDRLGITRRVRLIESAVVEVPAVIGWLRPAIVLPMSAIAGLPPAHLEAILAHELAHVRRGDYLINVCQSVVEVLLFYHPAVWWVSRQIRIAREECCDDMAADLCADHMTYAQALVSLEELRARTPALVMAATGGDLLGRIRRLIEPGSSADPGVSGRFAMSVALTIVLLAVSSQIKGMPAVEPVNPLPAIESRVEPARPEPIANVPSARTRTEATTARQQAPASVERPDVPAPAAAPEATAAPAEQNAKLTGTVRDTSGGVLPGATVTVTSPASTAKLTTNTSASGEFTVSAVPGTYDITIALAGFKSARTRLDLKSGDALVLGVKLEVGSLTETITVIAPAGFKAATPASNAAPKPISAPDYFDAAKQHYEAGRLVEAEAMTARALSLLRAAKSDVQVGAAADTALPAGAPGASGPQRPIRVGGDIKEPRKIKDVKPAYPAEAQAAGVTGIVIVEALIAKDGSVSGATVLRSVPMLDDAALNAVRQWRFTPTLLNGVPVEVMMTVTVNFGSR